METNILTANEKVLLDALKGMLDAFHEDPLSANRSAAIDAAYAAKEQFASHSSQTEISLCKMCNSRSELRHDADGCCAVICSQCDVQTTWYMPGREQDAIDAWNRSAIASLQPAQEPYAWATPNDWGKEPLTTSNPQVVSAWRADGRQITELFASPLPQSALSTDAQKVRDQALEEAAKVAADLLDACVVSKYATSRECLAARQMAEQIEDAIRALQSQPAGKDAELSDDEILEAWEEEFGGDDLDVADAQIISHGRNLLEKGRDK